MIEEKEMTRPVVVKRSGKVEGIRGLFRSPTTDRLYVRYSYHGIDRQRTIYPKNLTFSELEKTAKSELNKLKKEVLSLITTPKKQRQLTPKELVSKGIKRLSELVRERWAMRGCGYAHIHRLLKTCENLAVCESKRQRDIEVIEAHNQDAVNKLINSEGVTPHVKFAHYTNISNVFANLIQDGIHHGKNPVASFAKVKSPMTRRKCSFNLEKLARVMIRLDDDDLRHEKEMQLFFRLCVETGQRPLDVFFFDVRKIENNHYYFLSHKTKREQRVSHALSEPVLKLIQEIIEERGTDHYKHVIKNRYASNESLESFWRYGVDTYTAALNRIIKKECDATLYQTRHFFVSEIFRQTNSDFWAEVFTHDGKDANQRYYLHIDQNQADEILLRFCNSFENEIRRIKS